MAIGFLFLMPRRVEKFYLFFSQFLDVSEVFENLILVDLRLIGPNGNEFLFFFLFLADHGAVEVGLVV